MWRHIWTKCFDDEITSDFWEIKRECRSGRTTLGTKDKICGTWCWNKSQIITSALKESLLFSLVASGPECQPGIEVLTTLDASLFGPHSTFQDRCSYRFLLHNKGAVFLGHSKKKMGKHLIIFGMLFYFICETNHINVANNWKCCCGFIMSIGSEKNLYFPGCCQWLFKSWPCVKTEMTTWKISTVWRG